MISLVDIDKLPKSPGVYLMKDSDGFVLYIGKANDIQARVRSHFSAKPTNGSFYDQVRSIDFVVTRNEIEAILLENTLIKEKQPHYNIRLKDDKRYPYLKLSLDEKFPRLYLTRTLPKKGEGKKKRDGSNPRFFGPYPHVRDARRALQTLQEIFPLRGCRIPSKDLKLDRPCLEFEMHQCLAPCVESECGAEEYRELALKVEKFLEGGQKAVAQDLEERMNSASGELAFEKAAIYRDALQAMKALEQKQSVSLLEEDSEDYLGVSQLGDVTCVVVLRRRGGAIRASQHYFLEADIRSGMAQILSAFIEQHYDSAPEIPRRILCSDVPDSQEILETWLSSVLAKKVSIRKPHRGPRLRLIEMATKNAEFHAAEQYRKTHGSKRRIDESVLRLGADLGLNRLPMRIEGFDVSHHGGEEPVASMVVFENGTPKKSGYRKFRIKTAAGGDDFRSMEEVIERRFSHTEDDFGQWPDLILIDGGPVQLEFAGRAIANVARRLDEPHRSRLEQMTAISLAKREEEVFLPDRKAPVVFDSRHLGLKLLQRVRDESHRFAIGFHRKRKGEERRTSVLASIPGIGPARMERLLVKFGSIEKIAEARPEEVAEGPGITLPLAELIVRACRENTG